MSHPFTSIIFPPHEHVPPRQHIPTEVPLRDEDAARLSRHLRHLFALRVSDCVGGVSSDAPLDPNFKYPNWLN